MHATDVGNLGKSGLVMGNGGNQSKDETHAELCAIKTYSNCSDKLLILAIVEADSKSRYPYLTVKNLS